VIIFKTPIRLLW